MIFVVGDSTVSKFEEVYYYHRYGWGTMLYNYFNDDIKINNLAMSGRSSLSFLSEDNYNEFKNNISKGDYLFIGFGHNDEKDDDPTRYTNPTGDINEPGSFKNILYKYYIKVAIDKGATPILCTPIARLDETNEYNGKHIHITKNGDYRQCIISLANELNLNYVDLTTYSMNINKKDGYAKSCLRHAITKGKIVNDKLIPDIGSVDQTHINIYGAKVFAYYIAKTLKNSNNSIKNIIKDNLIEPREDVDLVMDKDYVFVPYKEPIFEEYNAPDWFKTNDKNYVGIAFGDTGRGTLDIPNGYVAKEEGSKFVVGQQLKNSGVSTPLGKIALTSEGTAMIARKISVKENFEVTVKAHVIDFSNEAQAGFGVQLRDDLYLNLRIADKTINSNYVAASLVTTKGNMAINSSRVNGQLVLTDNRLNNYYSIDDEVTFKLNRLGQVVTVETTYKGNTYKNIYTDFDFTKIDNKNFYLCFYATRSTIVEFYDVNYVSKGISQGA